MKIQLSRIGGTALVILAAAVAGNQQTHAQTAVYNTVIYQGWLKDDFGPGWDDSPHTWDFLIKAVVPSFPCYDPDCLWPTNCPNCATFVLGTNSVIVNKGLFTTPIVIPSQLLSNSNGLYLQFAVRTNGGGEFTTLSPMQALTAAPYANLAQSALSVSGPISASSLTGTMPTGMLTGTFGSPLNFSNPSNVFAGDGSLLTHVDAATIGGLDPCNLPCFWKLTGNSGTDPSINFLGTKDDKALTLKVHDQIVMRYFPHPVGPDGGNIVGGAYVNSAVGGAGSVICGGGGLGLANVISNDHSAIVGGLANTIVGRESFIGGGWANRSDDYNSHCVVIGGGSNNLVNVDFGFIGGGANNMVTGIGSVVTGGDRNNVLDSMSVVAGGQYNDVQAPNSAISGGSGNKIMGETSTIGGGVANEIGGVSGAGRVSFIGAGSGNRIYAPGANIPADWDVIAGGNSNLVSGNWSVIAGGGYNTVLANNATLSGGYYNTITVRGHLGTVGGGANNYVDADSATIAGGFNNYIGGDRGFVGGGWFNSAYGVGSAIPGGMTNAAVGYASFAAGNRAKAMHDGAFVWSDSQNADFASTANDQFAVRAQNGVMIQGTTTALDLRGNGAIRVAGAGVASQGPVFIHRATPASISGHMTIIDHPLANGDPDAILLVTHNFSADTSSTPYEPNSVGVWYDGSRWTIYHEDTSVAMPAGRAFNVMIIKP